MFRAESFGESSNVGLRKGKREIMASADTKKDQAIKAVRDLFNDKSVSQSTTKELLEEVAEQIELLVSSIEEDDSDDED